MFLLVYLLCKYPSISILTIINKQRMGARPKVWGMWVGFIYIFNCACTDQLTVPGSGHQRNDGMQVGTSRIWLPSRAPCPLHVSHPLCMHPGPFRCATGPFGCALLHTDTGTRPHPSDAPCPFSTCHCHPRQASALNATSCTSPTGRSARARTGSGLRAPRTRATCSHRSAA